MIFKDFSDLLKQEAAKQKDGAVLVSYIDENIIDIRQRYNYDLRRLDLLVKPLFVQYNLFAEYALNDEICQILAAAKQIIQFNKVDEDKVKNVKNKIISTYRNIPGVKEEDSLSLKGRWARLEGKMSELANSPKIFSLLFGFNRIEFFAKKIVTDSNYFEQYLEIFTRYFNYENFERDDFDFQDCYVIEEQLARLSYGNKVWIYEVFAPFIKSVFSVLDSLANGKDLNTENIVKRSDLIIWQLLNDETVSRHKQEMHSAVEHLMEKSRINYRLKDYKFDKAKINSQIKYFSDVRKVRNNFEHTNPIFEMLKNINDLKALNRPSPKLMSDIDLVEYLPEKNMVKLRIDSYLDGLDTDFNPTFNKVYNDLMIDLTDELFGWYKPNKIDLTGEIMKLKPDSKKRNKNG